MDQSGLAYSIIQEVTSSHDTPFYECGTPPENGSISNQEHLPILGVNDVFTVGDFPVTVKEANGSNGVHSGWGYVTYPFLGDTRISVGFNNVSINTDYLLFKGVVETDYHPDWANVIDVPSLIIDIEKTFSEIKERIKAITTDIAEQEASGELSPD